VRALFSSKVRRAARRHTVMTGPVTMRVLQSARLLVACSSLLCVACSSQPTCELPRETPRALDLTRERDSAHLASDIAMADRAANAYGRRAAKNEPPADPRYLTVERLEQDARAYCRTLLAEKISATHNLDVARFERAMAHPHPHLSKQ
jgi:hypothetical protein